MQVMSLKKKRLLVSSPELGGSGFGNQPNHNKKENRSSFLLQGSIHKYIATSIKYRRMNT